MADNTLALVPAASKSKEEDEDTPRVVWHEQQEIILKRWGEQAASYRFLHDRAFVIYRTKNMWFSLPVIIISTLTGTANFAQGSFPESWKEFVPLGIGAMNLLAGMITTVAQFLRVAENMEGHRAASISFGKLSRNITVELSLPPEERSCGGLEYINQCRAEMDRLLEQSPNLPLKLVKAFGSKFKKSNFMKPDILEINELEVFKIKKDLVAEKRALEERAAAEIEAKVQRAATDMRERRREQRRNSVSHVGKSMDKLLSSIQLMSSPMPAFGSPEDGGAKRRAQGDISGDSTSSSEPGDVTIVELIPPPPASANGDEED